MTTSITDLNYQSNYQFTLSASLTDLSIM